MPAPTLPEAGDLAARALTRRGRGEARRPGAGRRGAGRPVPAPCRAQGQAGKGAGDARLAEIRALSCVLPRSAGRRKRVEGAVLDTTFDALPAGGARRRHAMEWSGEGQTGAGRPGASASGSDRHER